MSSEPLRPALTTSAVVRRILVATATGGFAFLVSALADQSPISSITLSILIGGVILLTQLLIDFEKRVEGIEIRQQSANQINEATQLLQAVGNSALEPTVVTDLLQNTAHFGHHVPTVIRKFAEHEVARVGELLKQLSQGKAIYDDGEDHDWILSLTRVARRTIDATSTTTVDGYGSSFKGGFWASDHGQRYLKAQAEAIQGDNKVVIRRLFILENSDDLSDPDFLSIVQSQAAAGIKVMALHYDQVPAMLLGSRVDVILFDGEIAYELIPAPSSNPQPGYLMTHLITKPQHVTERKTSFESLWALAEHQRRERETRHGLDPGDPAL